MECATRLQTLAIRPRTPSPAFNQTLHSMRPLPEPVRVWSMITFGFELQMLLLHMRTLADVVDGFIVSESLHSFQTRHKKPLVLTEALRNGSIPAALAGKTSVRVISLAEIEAKCGGRGRHLAACFEARQRLEIQPCAI